MVPGSCGAFVDHYHYGSSDGRETSFCMGKFPSTEE